MLPSERIDEIRIKVKNELIGEDTRDEEYVFSNLKNAKECAFKMIDVLAENGRKNIENISF